MKTFLALSLLLALPAAGVAGDAASALPGPGDRVRVWAASGPSFTGRVVQIDSETLSVFTRRHQPPRVVPLTSLRGLERSLGRRGAMRRGALLGFIGGFLLGTEARFGVTCLAEGRPCPHRVPALAGGASVGAITAAAGTLIGCALGHEQWESLLPPRAAALHVRPALAPVRGGVTAGIIIGF